MVYFQNRQKKWSKKDSNKNKIMAQIKVEDLINSAEIGKINNLIVAYEVCREIISKIENRLFIKLRKDDLKSNIKTRITDLSSATTLKISDLKNEGSKIEIESVEINDDLKLDKDWESL